ncbi:MAG: hypothetical protein IIX53_02010 [Phascolarctobacterium sp.]|nr:hypothetical protein [Phascolarctobacterium sp.]MBQ5672658.1 hypothetical protein [Phascolarctobacterium sp.]
MAKNRFAQPLYGKIIYIFETDLKMEELSTIFSPKTYWIDVTGIDCEVGYIQEFREGEGIVWVAPPNEEYTFEDEQKRMLEKVNAWTAAKITGGFVSTCYNGENILYDTDVDTQITMQFAKNCCDSDRFAEELPDGLEVRGYEQVDVDEDGTLVFSKDKTIYYFSPEQIKTWNEDFALFLRECKKEGWMKQAEVKACTTKEELAKVDLN